MTVGRGFKLHPLAARDTADIWTYIAEDSPQAARPLRFTIVHEYLIAYAPEEKPLWVIAVMHGRRNPRVMAAILRSRS
jgi:plasmid stabilization system protein ParE